MPDNNANGWSGVKIDYGGVSPQEALMQGAQLNERRKERADTLAVQKANREQQNQWNDFKLVQDIGKDFKPLPQRLQDFSNQKLQDIKAEFSDPQYLSLDPALLGSVIQQKIQPFIQWHQQAESAATAFDDNFKLWSSAYSNVPANEAYEWGAGQFANDFLTSDKDGKLTFQNPSLIRPRDYVNGDPNNPTIPSLSNPEVLGQFNVDLTPLTKAAAAIQTDVQSDKEVRDNKGNVHSLSWSVPTTSFSQLEKDANGIPLKSALTYKPVAGTDMRLVTPEFKQAVINSPATVAAAAKLANIAHQSYEQTTGKPVDDKMKPYMQDAALYHFFAPQMEHPVKIAETQRTPKTTNVFNIGKEPPLINNRYAELQKLGRNLPDGTPRVLHTDELGKQYTAVPMSQFSSEVNQAIVGKIKAITGQERIGNSDVYIRQYGDDDFGVYNKEGEQKLITKVTYEDLDLDPRAGNTTAPQRQVVLKQAAANHPATPATATTIIPKGRVR